MESWATISVKFPVSDQSKWDALVVGLSRNEHGACFEEYAEVFGTKAEEYAGYVLDEWEVERDNIDTRSSEVAKGKAVIRISGYEAVAASVQPMVNFLKVCGATRVAVNKEYDSNGS